MSSSMGRCSYARVRRRGELSRRTFLPNALFPLLLFIFLLSSCDSSFDPVVQDQAEFYGVFGFLDTAADTQFVRVSPLRETLEPSGELVVPQVVSTHLATGEQTVWQDSIVVLDDGRRGQLFFAQVAVNPGDTYRLEVRGPEGEVTRAVTEVPSRLRIAPQPIARGFNQRWVQRVTLLGQPLLPYQVTMFYEMTPPGAEAPIRLSSFFLGDALSTAGVQVIVNLEFDREEILNRLSLPQIDSTIVLNSINLEIEEVSAEWGRTDTAEAPGNVENGFGSFASVARYTISWTLDEAALRRIGYRAPG